MCNIRPDELRQAVASTLSKSAEQIVAFESDEDLNKRFHQERRRWSMQIREARISESEIKLLAVKVKQLNAETKRIDRLARKRATEAVKRKVVAESCRGLPRTLVPTNIPEKHGSTDRCYKVIMCAPVCNAIPAILVIFVQPRCNRSRLWC